MTIPTSPHAVPHRDWIRVDRHQSPYERHLSRYCALRTFAAYLDEVAVAAGASDAAVSPADEYVLQLAVTFRQHPVWRLVEIQSRDMPHAPFPRDWFRKTGKAKLSSMLGVVKRWARNPLMEEQQLIDEEERLIQSVERWREESLRGDEGEAESGAAVNEQAMGRSGRPRIRFLLRQHPRRGGQQTDTPEPSAAQGRGLGERLSPSRNTTGPSQRVDEQRPPATPSLSTWSTWSSPVNSVPEGWSSPAENPSSPTQAQPPVLETGNQDAEHQSTTEEEPSSEEGSAVPEPSEAPATPTGGGAQTTNRSRCVAMRQWVE